MNVPEMTLAMVEILKAGGFKAGGLNFDAKIRRQSIDPDDLLHAHIGSMDACARALLNAERIMADGEMGRVVETRYAGWSKPENANMLAGKESLADISARVLAKAIEPQPRSGRQEYLEGLLNRFV